MKPCRECGKEVASSAKKCPHCGIDYPGSKVAAAGQNIQQIGCALTLLPILIVFLVILLGRC